MSVKANVFHVQIGKHYQETQLGLKVSKYCSDRVGQDTAHDNKVIRNTKSDSVGKYISLSLSYNKSILKTYCR